MIEMLKAGLAKLDGWKTHVSVVLAMAWVVVYLRVPGAKDAIGLDNFGTVLVALLGAASISMRSAVAKAQAAAGDAPASSPGAGDGIRATPAPSDAKAAASPTPIAVSDATAKT